MAIKPYVSGSVPENIHVGDVGDDGLSAPLNVTIKADATEQHVDAYTPEIAVKSGEPDYRDRFRGSLDGETWSEWGTLPTIQPVTDTGTVMAIQGRWVTGDPATARAASLVLPQTGITIVEGGELPPIVDTGEGTDTGTVDAVRPLPDATDSGEGTDTAVLDSAGDPSLPVISDTGEGSDDATLTKVAAIVGVTDDGEGADTAALETLLPPPALTSMTAGDASFTVTVGSVSGASSYDLRWKTSAGSTWTERANVGTGTETVTGLTNGTAYDVQARTNNAAGNGAWSATVNVTPVAAGVTGTYYTVSAERSGDVAGDRQLSLTFDAGAGHVASIEPEEDYFDGGRMNMHYALFRINQTSSGAVENLGGGWYAHLIKDWTLVGYIDDSVSGHESGQLQQLFNQSLSNPSIGAGELWAARFKTTYVPTGQTGLSPYYTHQKGTNPGAQTASGGMVVSLNGAVDGDEAYINAAATELYHPGA